MEIENELINQWESLPNELIYTILTSLDKKSRNQMCQSDLRISNFCRDHNLIMLDDVINENNPSGELIDTKIKHAEYILRGYETVYSLILNEEIPDVNNANYTNVPEDPSTIQILGLKAGLNKGTVYFTENYRRQTYHLAIKGLPPPKGIYIKFFSIFYWDNDDPPEIQSIPYTTKEFLIESVNSLGNPDPIRLLKSEGSLKTLFETSIVSNGYVTISLWSIPAP